MGSAIFHDAYMVTGINNSEQNVRITWSESYDAATNKSTVTLTKVEIASNLFLGSCVFRGIVKFNGTVVKEYPANASTYTVNIPGGVTNYGTVSGGGGSSIEVTHDSLGAASFTITVVANVSNYFGASYSSGGYSGIFGVASGKTATPSLTTHPRASTIASRSSSVNTQGTFSLTVTRNSSAFYHKATFKIGNTTMETSPAFATSLSYNIPRTWFNGYPNDVSKTVTVSVQTYTNSACTTAVGSPVTTTFTMTADAGMKPTVEPGWVTLSPHSSNATIDGWGVYVKGYSYAQASFNSGHITLVNNATIASYSVTCQGTTDSSFPYQTPVLASTSVSVVCKVTDSRGRSASETFTLSVYDYAKPKLSGISVYRCDSSGNADPEGTKCSVKATATGSSVNGKNSVSLACAIAQPGGSYSGTTSLTSGTAKRPSWTLSADITYSVRIRATDTAGNVTTYYVTIPARKWAMKFRPDGNGVAFGKSAEYDSTFEVSPDWTVKLGQPLGVPDGGTGVTTYAALLSELGLGVGAINLKFGYVKVAANSTGTIDIGGGAHGIMLGIGATDPSKCAYIINTNSSGTFSFKSIASSSSVTVNGNNGVMSITNSLSVVVYALVIYVTDV